MTVQLLQSYVDHNIINAQRRRSHYEQQNNQSIKYFEMTFFVNQIVEFSVLHK